jgi:hypothetical protein
VPKPPPLVLLAYRFVGWRVGPVHAEWVRDDIVSSGWLTRQAVPVLVVVLALGAGLTTVVDGNTARVVQLVAVLAAVGLFFRGALRERALRRQGIDASGEPLAEATWYADDRARRRRNLAGALATVLLTVAALALLALRSRP